LLAALALTVLEGSARKLILPGNDVPRYLMYFSKDICFALLLLLPRRSPPSRALKVFEKWLVPGCVLLGLGAVVSCAYGFNPVGAVLTVRAVLILPLLVWRVVPRLAGLRLRWVLLLLVACTVVNFALGSIQNRLPAGHVLNRYAADDALIAEVPSGVRATGTFAYITGMGVISAVGIWAGMALMSVTANQRERAAAWMAIAAGFGCGLASVSRGPIIVGVVMMASWLVGSKRGLSKLIRGSLAGVCCLVAALALGLLPVYSELGQGLLQRHATASDTFNDRAFRQIEQVLGVLRSYPLGNGFGTEQVGGQYYVQGMAVFNKFEDPLPRLVLETGFLGLFGYLLLCAAVTLALQEAKRGATSGVRAMLLATQLFMLMMFYGSVVFNHTAAAFTWFILAGVLASAELTTKPTATDYRLAGVG